MCWKLYQAYGHFLHAKYRKNPLLQKMCTLEGDLKKKLFFKSSHSPQCVPDSVFPQQMLTKSKKLH